MVKLTIDLQKGFANDLVVIRANNQEVFRKERVQTSLLLGYADSLEIEAPEGAVRIEIMLPSKKLSKMIEFQVSVDTFLGISVQEEGIKCRISNEPFGYL